ncbi:MAG: 5'-3' exonuclease [Enterobacterales bacterium]
MKKKLIIIDGSCYLYRAFYALQSMKNRFHESTGAIYLTLNMIKNLLKKYPHNYVVIIFDCTNKNFRNDLYSKYKKNRLPTPKNLLFQINPLIKLIQYIGIHTITNINTNVEADDIIGSLSKKMSKSGIKVLISTYDKDMIQLINNNIYITHHTSNCIWNVEKIKLKFGFNPKLFVDYLALIGDKSDNIPGVSGIGVKTASELLNKIGKLKLIYKNLDKIYNLCLRRPKYIVDKLKNNHSHILLSYKLAKIKTNFLINIKLSQLKIKNSTFNKLNLILEKYKINKILIEDIKNVIY